MYVLSSNACGTRDNANVRETVGTKSSTCQNNIFIFNPRLRTRFNRCCSFSVTGWVAQRFCQFFEPVQPQLVSREQARHYGAEHGLPSDGYQILAYFAVYHRLAHGLVVGGPHAGVTYGCDRLGAVFPSLAKNSSRPSVRPCHALDLAFEAD